MMSATLNWCLLSCLPDQMMVSSEFSLRFPVPVNLASAILMMASLLLFISRVACDSLPLRKIVRTFLNLTRVRRFGVRRSIIGLETSFRLWPPAVIKTFAWSISLQPGEVNSFAVVSGAGMFLLDVDAGPTLIPSPLSSWLGTDHDGVNNNNL